MSKRNDLRSLLKFLAAVIFLFVASTSMRAECKPKPYSDLEVSEVRGMNPQTDETRLHNPVRVRIEWLSEWTCQQGNDPSKLILYLDGFALKGLPIKTDQVTNNVLSYVLSPTTDAAQQEWKKLLARPDTFERPITVTVGLENQVPVKSKYLGTPSVKLVILSRVKFWIFVAALILLLVFFVWLAFRSDILRDGGPAPSLPGRKPFSLGRTQMAFWFILVVASYSFVWIVTSAYGSLSASVLGLIGISAVTALSAAVIDGSKRNAAMAEVGTLKKEEATLQGTANLDAASAARLKEISARIDELNKTIDTEPGTGNFFRDVLSDANGISFHRFQIFVWTLVLGVIFVAAVYNVLAMPDYPEALLALMGISGGTYLGFKFPEKPR